MTLRNFEKLPALLVMHESDIDKAVKNTKKGEFILDEHVQIVSYPLSAENSNEPALLALSQKHGSAIVNKLFVLDPYNPESYMEAALLHKRQLSS